MDEDGNRFLVYGSKPYEKYEEALLKRYPKAQKKEIDTNSEALFDLYWSYTARTFTEISGKSIDEVGNVLGKLISEGKIKKQKSKNGSLWIKA